MVRVLSSKLPLCAMSSGFVNGLKTSATLRSPTALDEEWFNGDRESRTQAISVERGARPRAAALALVLREVDGKVEMLVIKRATNPRRVPVCKVFCAPSGGLGAAFLCLFDTAVEVDVLAFLYPFDTAIDVDVLAAVTIRDRRS